MFYRNRALRVGRTVTLCTRKSFNWLCRHAYAELELLNAGVAIYVCRPSYIMFYKVICELLGEHELGSRASLQNMMS